MKTPSALGLAATGGLAAIAMLLFSSQHGTPFAESDGTQLFLSKVLGADEQAYIEWLGKYGKSYATKEEYHFRLEQFKRTRKEIAEHDTEYHGFEVGLNAFSDYTEEEWQRKFTDFKLPPENQVQEEQGEVPAEWKDPVTRPESVDWRKEGAITPVKDMKDCKASWAFSGVGALEGAYAIQFGILRDFSEQQMIDCVRGESNFGCDGGRIPPVYAWLMENRKGIVQTERYPYTGKQGDCQPFDWRIDQGFVAGYRNVGRTEVLQNRLPLNVVSVGLSISSPVFRNYKSGIITKDCGDIPNHAGVAVGYGTDPSGQEFIIVKNSWGTTWGEDGYVRVAPDQCGMMNMASMVVMRSP